MPKLLQRTLTTTLVATAGLLGCQAPPGALNTAATDGGAPVRVSAVSGSHVIEVDPLADSVILRGYTDPGAVTAKVELLRPDATTFPLDFNKLVVIGTATGRLGVGGELGINTPGGTCWETFSPDILPGDHVRVTLDTQQTDETRVAFVTVDPPMLEGNKVTVRGNATDGFHRALPLNQLEVQLISRTGQFLTSGRAEVRANTEPDAFGTIAFNPAPLAPGDFTVTFTRLQTADYPRALAATARVAWLGANPDGGNERTIFDNPELPTGAAVGCMPAKLNAITVTDHPLITPENQGTPIRLAGVAQGDVTRVSVSINGGPPVEVLLQPLPHQKAWSAVIPPGHIGAPSAGPFTAVASFSTPAGPPIELASPEQEAQLAQLVMPLAAGDNLLAANPAGGTFPEPQLIELTALIPGSTVFYTLDGSTPTEQSPRYTGPLRVAEATTAKFFAKLPNGAATPIKSETYRFDAPYYIAANPMAGTYAIAQYVNLTTTRPATIYYTLDGSAPDPAAVDAPNASRPTRRYTGQPILMARTTTLKFLGVDRANQRTPVAEEVYTIQDTQAPTVGARPYQVPPKVTVLGPNRSIQLFANEDATIFYTTDGSMPTTASTRYNGKGIALTAAMLRAGRDRRNGVPVSFMAVDLAGNASPVVTGFYQP